MAGSPQTRQGTLNRLRGSVIIPDHPELNVTAPFLGREGISLAFEGETTVMLPTLVGTVTSPEPYQLGNLSFGLLKTQGLAELFKKQLESNSVIGDVTIIPDASTLSNYDLTNCAIAGVRDLSFNGEVVGFMVAVRGFYAINADLWLAS